MRNRGLFFYTYENNEQEYNEITNLILELSKLSKMTDEQEIFLKDFYFRLLFRIAVLEKSNASNEKILEELGELFDIGKINQIRTKYSLVVEKIKEKLEKIEN